MMDSGDVRPRVLQMLRLGARAATGETRVQDTKQEVLGRPLGLVPCSALYYKSYAQHHLCTAHVISVVFTERGRAGGVVLPKQAFRDLGFILRARREADQSPTPASSSLITISSVSDDTNVPKWTAWSFRVLEMLEA